MWRACCLRPLHLYTPQLALMRMKDVAKEHDWANRLEVRGCPADLGADTDIPVVLTMLTNAAGEREHCDS